MSERAFPCTPHPVYMCAWRILHGNARGRSQHTQLLQENQHVRYMWVPYTDTVVVVTNNPIEAGAVPPAVVEVPMAERLEPFRALMKAVKPDMGDEAMATMSFADYRDALIAAAPLDTPHIKAVNRAEAEFWKRSEVHTHLPRLPPRITHG